MSTPPSYSISPDTSAKEREVDVLAAREPSYTPIVQARLLHALALVQRVSAIGLGMFMTVHLAAPIAANFGGVDASNGVMMIGREIYQTRMGEQAFVEIPLALHIVSGVARRVLLSYPTWRASFQSSHRNFTLTWSNIKTRIQGLYKKLPRPSILQVTAYLSVPGVIVHRSVHRLTPSLPSPPISSYSPSELSYTFVQTGLKYWPILSWVTLGGLVGTVVVHAVEGQNVIAWWLSGRRIERSKRRWIQAGMIGGVLGGLAALHWGAGGLSMGRRELERVMAVYREAGWHPPVQY